MIKTHLAPKLYYAKYPVKFEIRHSACHDLNHTILNSEQLITEKHLELLEFLPVNAKIRIGWQKITYFFEKYKDFETFVQSSQVKSNRNWRCDVWSMSCQDVKLCTDDTTVKLVKSLYFGKYEYRIVCQNISMTQYQELVQFLFTEEEISQYPQLSERNRKIHLMGENYRMTHVVWGNTIVYCQGQQQAVAARLVMPQDTKVTKAVLSQGV